jgi:Family of unknown function (DUF5709)
MARVRGYDSGGDEDDVGLDAADEASLRLEPEDVLEDDADTDPGELGYSPEDRPWAVDDPVVSGEQESLDRRLSEEQPDGDDPGDDDGDGLGDVRGTDGELRDDEVGDDRAGRLAGTDAGSESAPDGESDLEAFDEGRDGGAASAEEAAVHVVGREAGDGRG